jgi:hypothetical protein
MSTSFELGPVAEIPQRRGTVRKEKSDFCVLQPGYRPVAKFLPPKTPVGMADVSAYADS